MEYRGMIMWLERIKEELLMREDDAMADVIDDAIIVVKLHSPLKPKVVRTPMGSVPVCSNCDTQIYHSDMMCRNCTQVIDWGDEE